MNIVRKVFCGRTYAQGVFHGSFSTLQIPILGSVFRKMKRFFVFSTYVVLCFVFNLLGAEEDRPESFLFPELQGKLRFPMEIQTPVSGSFAEYRTHHLHMGADFKTFHLNGFPAIAPFDGVVESVSESPTGYGLNLMLRSSSGL
ncbi:M23 family peptidase, partial [Leptospira santarosai]